MIDSQENLLRHVEWEMEQIRVDQDGLINNMIEPFFLEGSASEGYVRFRFTVKPWAVNKSGTVHGGILATCCDCVMAMFARYYAGGSFAPTVSIDMKHLRPMRAGDEFTVSAYRVNAGRRIIQLRCDILTGENKVAATGVGVFMNNQE